MKDVLKFYGNGINEGRPWSAAGCAGIEMSEDARQKFLDAFQADAPDAVIGFCVMGGIFGGH